MGTTFTPEDVAGFEHATWSRCAAGYRGGFAVLTGEAVDSLLASAGLQSHTRLLDLGTGSGVVAAVARERGASVIGIDFSDAMLVEARRTVPGVQFRAGSAASLPFEDEAFDAVVANCVLHHLAEPATALREARRVLVPEGRIACTVWAAPETLKAFGLFFTAVEEHAGAAELPHGPLFGITDEAVLAQLFSDAGFSDVTFETVDTSWRMTSIESLLGAFATWAQLDSFPIGTRRAIEESVRSAAVAYHTGDGLTIPNPMLLIAATKKA